MIIIGIDPDVDRSGTAVWNREKKELELKSLTFFQLIDYLKAEKDNIKIVKVEAGWLHQKSNFHNKINYKKYYIYNEVLKYVNTASKISKNVGENQATGKKIVEMCQYLEIPYKLVKPFQKNWDSPTGKISAQQLKENLDRLKINLANKTNNQDGRDSALICLYG